MTFKRVPLLFVIVFTALSCNQSNVSEATNKSADYQAWDKDRANMWYDELGWVSGCNFNPSTSINQIEMWQASTWDPETIDRELGWAEELGFNIMRVYLHYLPWQADASGFKQRIDQYLEISDKHGMKTMFVLFDDCWYGDAQMGEQPDPIPGLHNSYWLQCPRYAEVMDESVHPILEKYTKDIISTYANDARVAVWDLYNEPGANHAPEQIFPLVKKVFKWAREVDPPQPLTMGIWIHKFRPGGYQEMIDYQTENSDIITFHCYGNLENARQDISDYRSFGRPLIATEYLARGNGNNFDTHLPYFKKMNVGAINWGLVTGKTQTMYAWGSPLNAPEPDLWHHDILRPDGTPFDQDEVAIIKSVNNVD